MSYTVLIIGEDNFSLCQNEGRVYDTDILPDAQWLYPTIVHQL